MMEAVSNVGELLPNYTAQNIPEDVLIQDDGSHKNVHHRYGVQNELKVFIMNKITRNFGSVAEALMLASHRGNPCSIPGDFNSDSW
jgi:hypothetical protein